MSDLNRQLQSPHVQCHQRYSLPTIQWPYLENRCHHITGVPCHPVHKDLAVAQVKTRQLKEALLGMPRGIDRIAEVCSSCLEI